MTGDPASGNDVISVAANDPTPTLPGCELEPVARRIR